MITLLILLMILVVLASIHWLAAAVFLVALVVAYAAVEGTKSVGRAVADSAADAIGNTVDRYEQRRRDEEGSSER